MIVLRNFRTLEQAKKDLHMIQTYVDLIENYEPKTFTQKVIWIYSLEGNLERTAKRINEMYLLIDRKEMMYQILYYQNQIKMIYYIKKYEDFTLKKPVPIGLLIRNLLTGRFL